MNGNYAVSLLVMLVLSSAVKASDISFVGSAYDMATDKLLYTEHHQQIVSLDGDIERSTVKYYSPEQELIAEKELFYSDLQTMPELEFVDHRSRSTFQTSNIRYKLKTNVLLQSMSLEGSKQNVLEVGIDKLAVTDAGFELLVKNNWEKLLKGDELEFQFLALTRARYFDFILQVNSIDDDFLILSLEPDSWLISLLMDPILLTYEISSRRLVQFEGITNIEEFIEGKATGKNFIARIKYSYQSPRLNGGEEL